MNTQLMVNQKLPVIPVNMHPIVGRGIREDKLIPHHDFPDVETAVADYRKRHAPELQFFSRVYYTENTRHRNMLRVRYLWSRIPRRTWVVGETDNSPEAVKILIGNNIANLLMGSGIRWELYEDRNCEELSEMGRIDQWDLLKGISAEKMKELNRQGICPVGKWDFDGFLYERSCSVCGSSVSVSYFFFSVDSAVCSKCGNRPYLSSSIHNFLDYVENIRFYREEDATMHVLMWMSSAQAMFEEVRRDIMDNGGLRIKALAEKTLIWQATNRGTADRTRALIERNTTISFGMYKEACGILRKAMLGKEPFREEHKIAADFVAKVTELIRVKRLSTSQ